MGLSDNIIYLTDSYKVTHHKVYPRHLQKMYSYFESRGGAFPETVSFGLHYYLEKYISQIISKGDIEECDNDFKGHFGNDAIFNKYGWNYIRSMHRGRLPVEIKAVPEGTVVPTKNVLLTIENLDENVPWLTNYLETLLSQIWYPSTVATLSRECKKVIYKYLDETGDIGLINFKLHDFGFRGTSSVESAAIGGAAHLVNFMGTDTMVALKLLKQYYDEPMAGFSIPATEHSTITSWGREHEFQVYEHVVDTFSNMPNIPAYACVIDSYDPFEAIRMFGRLKEKIFSGKNQLVLRPDSGDPVAVSLKCLEIMAEEFGCEKNEKGFKVLHSKVRLIWGDGIDYAGIGEVLAALKAAGWSADNIAFGMGGGLLQKVHRDTQKFAFKCSDAKVDGEHRDVFKNPSTDPGKVSKKGRLKLIIGASGVMQTVDEKDIGADLLTTVYHPTSGVQYKPTLTEIRRRAAIE